MTRIQDMLAFALTYLRKGLPTQGYKLQGNLQYRFCVATDRLLETFGEVTKKDIANLVDAWCMAHREDPLENC